jgi:hypothetical protein
MALATSKNELELGLRATISPLSTMDSQSTTRNGKICKDKGHKLVHNRLSKSWPESLLERMSAEDDYILSVRSAQIQSMKYPESKALPPPTKVYMPYDRSFRLLRTQSAAPKISCSPPSTTNRVANPRTTQVHRLHFAVLLPAIHQRPQHLRQKVSCAQWQQPSQLRSRWEAIMGAPTDPDKPARPLPDAAATTTTTPAAATAAAAAVAGMAEQSSPPGSRDEPG